MPRTAFQRKSRLRVQGVGFRIQGTRFIESRVQACGLAEEQVAVWLQILAGCGHDKDSESPHGLGVFRVRGSALHGCRVWGFGFRLSFSRV